MQWRKIYSLRFLGAVNVILSGIPCEGCSGTSSDTTDGKSSANGDNRHAGLNPNSTQTQPDVNPCNPPSCKSSMDSPSFQTVCGSDKNLYYDACEYDQAKCKNKKLEKVKMGKCVDGRFSMDTGDRDDSVDTVEWAIYGGNVSESNKLCNQVSKQCKSKESKKEVKEHCATDKEGIYYKWYTPCGFCAARAKRKDLTLVFPSSTCRRSDPCVFNTCPIGFRVPPLCGNDKKIYHTFCHVKCAREKNKNLRIDPDDPNAVKCLGAKEAKRWENCVNKYKNCKEDVEPGIAPKLLPFLDKCASNGARFRKCGLKIAHCIDPSIKEVKNREVCQNAITLG